MRAPRGRHDYEPGTVGVDEQANEDFAFADTVVAADLTLQSGGAFAPDALLPSQAVPSGPDATVRSAWLRVRRSIEAYRAEMGELWSATACVDPACSEAPFDHHREGALTRAATVGRRLRAFLSLFEWDRADLLRAAWLGLLVLVVVATAGAFALQNGASEAVSPPGAPSR